MMEEISLRQGNNFVKKMKKKLKVFPVGSIVQKKEKLKDIDLISLSPLNKIHQYLKDNYVIVEELRKGKKIISIIIKLGNKPIKINAWRTNKSNYPYIYFTKSYPQQFNIEVKSNLKRKGYKLNDYGIYKGQKKITNFTDSNGKSNKFKNNRDFFKFFKSIGYNKKYRSPQKEYNGGNIIKEAAKRVVGALKGPRKTAPPAVRKFIKDYSDYKIVALKVCRDPIMRIIDKVLNFVSLGKWQKNKNKFHYDDLFHLYILMTIQKGDDYVNVRIDKNHVVEVKLNVNKKCESEKIVKVPDVSIQQFFNNGEKYQGNNFWNYDPVSNNCQVFVISLLRGNNVSSKDVEEFVLQNVKSILTGTSKKIAKIITDIAGAADILFHGNGFNVCSECKGDGGCLKCKESGGCLKCQKCI